MEFSFYRYFLNYVTHSKTRQKLLFLAGFGLLLSALSLTVIQGIMGGLQRGLIGRSKSVLGVATIKVNDLEEYGKLQSFLKREGIEYSEELIFEMMAKRGQYVAPVKVVGINEKTHLPLFLRKKDFSGLVLSSEVSYKLKSALFSDIELISPAHTVSIMGEIPRMSSTSVSDYLVTDVSEVDQFYVYCRLSFLQNLIAQKIVNNIRIYKERDLKRVQSYFKQYPSKGLILLTWEKMNNSLVWALKLETGVMIILFSAMSFLVAIATIAGLLLFYDKIKIDLLSFWLLGLSQKNIFKFIFRFTQLYAIVSCLSGVIFGIGILKILELYGHVIMPDIFVEETFPIYYSLNTMSMAILVPYVICLIFSYISFDLFRKENTDYLSLVRSLHS